MQVEDQAAGTPVIAFGRGGVTETVVSAKEARFDKATGIFFNEQTVASLTAAVKDFIRIEDKFDRKVIRKNAEQFSTERFMLEIREKVNEAVFSAGC